MCEVNEQRYFHWQLITGKKIKISALTNLLEKFISVSPVMETIQEPTSEAVIQNNPSIQTASELP